MSPIQKSKFIFFFEFIFRVPREDCKQEREKDNKEGRIERRPVHLSLISCVQTKALVDLLPGKNRNKRQPKRSLKETQQTVN